MSQTIGQQQPGFFGLFEPIEPLHDDRNRGPLLLGAFSLAGYFVFYALNLFLARNLPREAFDGYNVGISTLLLLVALAPLGLEKLSLKVTPVLTERRDWGRLRGFLRFALLATLGVSGALAIGFYAALGSRPDLPGGLALPLIVACLPLLSLFSVLLEVATASGAPIAAAALYRIAVPVLMLGFNAAWWGGGHRLSGASASACFAAAWLCVMGAMGWLVRSRLPGRLGEAKPIYERRAWLRESTPLLLNGLLLTTIAQSGVIVLKLSEAHSDEASIFAVAMQTGAFIVLFATSANRFYLPRLSLLIDRRDRSALIRLRRHRLLLVGSICAVFVTLVVVFGRALLRAHGEGFEAGYHATIVIAIGASVSTLFSLSSIGLQYLGMHRYVLKKIALAALLSVAACVVLSNRYGVFGASLAYAMPLIWLHVKLARKSTALLNEEGELGAGA